jgi:hypothetical protein
LNSASVKTKPNKRVEVSIYATELQKAVFRILADREGITIGALLDDRWEKIRRSKETPIETA